MNRKNMSWGVLGRACDVPGHPGVSLGNHPGVSCDYGVSCGILGNQIHPFDWGVLTFGRFSAGLYT